MHPARRSRPRAAEAPVRGRPPTRRPAATVRVDRRSGLRLAGRRGTGRASAGPTAVRAAARRPPPLRGRRQLPRRDRSPAARRVDPPRARHGPRSTGSFRMFPAENRAVRGHRATGRALPRSERPPGWCRRRWRHHVPVGRPICSVRHLHRSRRGSNPLPPSTQSRRPGRDAARRCGSAGLWRRCVADPRPRAIRRVCRPTQPSRRAARAS